MKNKYIQIPQQLARKVLLELLENKEFCEDKEIRKKFGNLSAPGNDSLPKESLSRVIVDKKCRIILPDYAGTEVTMSYLPKTVFLFFLIHTAGIEFKNMHKYARELYTIYQIVSIERNIGSDKIKHCIDNLVNIQNNRIYEVCSVIRRSLLKAVQPPFIHHYCISGKRGKVRQLPLDRNLVFIENERLRDLFQGNNGW